MYVHDCVTAMKSNMPGPSRVRRVPLQPTQYPLSRPDYYDVAFAAAEASDAKAMMPWQLLPWDPVASDTFDFGPGDPTFVTVAAAIAYQKSRV